MSAQDNLSPQQFYHGTDKDIEVGGMVEPGHKRNFTNSEPDKVYFSGRKLTAYTYSDKAMRRNRTTQRAIYQVEPTGPSEPDYYDAPHMASYQSRSPLRVVRKLTREEYDD